MKRSAMSLVLLLSLTACQRADEPENASSTGTVNPALPPSAAKRTVAAKVTLDPSTFENCSPSKFATAKVSWDASASGAGIVDVKTAAADGAETLFATSAAIGSKVTGPWIGPGSIIVVRHHDTGAELGRVVAGSKPCGT